jgi:CubicO group peptidase (beta-lactamase class C family)
MTSTGNNYTDFTGRNAIPYEQADTQLFEGPIYNQYGLGDGALRSTVPDLAKFLIAHMNNGTYNNSQILLPQTVDLMHTSEIGLSGYELGGYTLSGQGLGWQIYTDNIIGHGGGIPGYLANMAFKTVSNGKYGIVVTLNKGSSLVQDSYLLFTIFPSIIEVLFDEAVRLFSL